MRGDEQEPDTRCGTPGASWHVTAKPSIHAGACFINPAHASKVVCLTPGGLHGVYREGRLSEERSEPSAVQKSAEGIVGTDRRGEWGTPRPKGGETEMPSRRSVREGPNRGADE